MSTWRHITRICLFGGGCFVSIIILSFRDVANEKLVYGTGICSAFSCKPSRYYKTNGTTSTNTDPILFFDINVHNRRTRPTNIIPLA